ncbi:putative F-box/LRR-repeat protein At4g13960 [Lotus japonicus]|uniref:putative F-box/LRR-repeat protein At4g13960 n=1 Tax=Lotus japonicus TaxID=34305 RepID=UPI00258A13BD|nr:putative F-box/LRR-repeat protein At4g13960 [Lotus japonicus]
MAPMADRISELPNELLFLILSFLPTEDIIATSLVSKRWRSLWLSVLTLDFDEDRYFKRHPDKQDYEQQRRCFIDFVRATLQARGSNQPIKGFRLLTCEDFHEHYVKTVLHNVTSQERSIQKFE